MKNASRLLMSGAALALALINATPVSAEGYWTDGWTDASGNWHDGYWTETSSGDSCGWVVDWSNPDGGYCSYSGSSGYSSGQSGVTYTQAGDSLYIPGIGYSVSLSADGDPQWIVDQPGLAWYSYWDGAHILIGDHAYQGLARVGSLPNGSTATLTIGGVQRTITKASTYSGYNYGSGLTLADGRDMTEVWDGTIVIYTCSSGDRVSITFWN